MEDSEGVLSFDFEGGLDTVPSAAAAPSGPLVQHDSSAAASAVSNGGPPAPVPSTADPAAVNVPGRRSFRQTVCRHWLRSLCMKGDACGFLHQYDKARMPVCRFFRLYGECREQDCVYKHTNEDIKECNMYKLGFCPNGPDCRYRHAKSPGPPPPVEEVLQKIQHLYSYNYNSSNKFFQQRGSSYAQQAEKSQLPQGTNSTNQVVTGKPLPAESGNAQPQQQVQQSQQQVSQSQMQNVANGQPNQASRSATPLPQGISRILTWEDAYYHNPNICDSSGNESCQNTWEQIGSADFSHDPLELAVAKMSYHVYSLGEGIVGQVAVTGKHRWIFEDNQVTSSGPSLEIADGWQSQFSAGIRTIIVIAVVPIGVVQLGSLNKVAEDMGVIACIRSLFLSNQDYTIHPDPNQVQNMLKSSSSVLDSKTSESVPAYLHNTEKTMKHESLDNLMPFQGPRNNYSPHAVNQKMTVDEAKHERPELYGDGNFILLQSMSNMMNVEQQKFLGMRPINERKFELNSSGCDDTSVGSGKNLSSFLHNLVTGNNCVNDLVCPSKNVGVDSVSFSEFLDTAVCESEKFHYVDINQNGVLNWTRPSDAYSRKDTGKSELQTEPCSKDTAYTLKFPAGYELHEALGPSFLRRIKYFDWAVKANQDVKAAEMSDELSCSQLTSESQPEHLLEAMVANICHSNNNVNRELSFSTTMQAAIASGSNPEDSIHTVHTINSDSCSIDQPHVGREEKHYNLGSSGICGIMSPKGFSSTCPSSCSEQFERSSEPTKNSKKRARPGESCRPRPRDRQLIQDRIKELRELVPNGAKCSIDSLLECTIKHMLFLKNVTKDKLNKFTDTKTKLHHMEKDINGSSRHQQGSSWAMEVGGHLKVRSILVENLNKNGQMLVEMLCEECSHFLEIAEAIRSMGLTILNGATEAHGEKTCICFVVEAGSEGQNNRNLHRLDILWPLVQLLQSKSTMYS